MSTFNANKGCGTTIEVAKLGDGTIDSPYRPDTDRVPWAVIEEKENSYTIETFDIQQAEWDATHEE